MNKIYGYFKGNLGDDLMLDQLLQNLGSNNCEIVLGRSNFVNEEFLSNKISGYSSIFTDDYQNFIFVGGSTIQLPKKLFSLMTLFHVKMIISFIFLKLKGINIVYWNTNLYDGKRYRLLLKIYLLFIDEIYVRDNFSANILEQLSFKNYLVIRDLVEEIDVKANAQNLVGISITETQSKEYIKQKIEYVKSRVKPIQKMVYIEFQKTQNREYIIELLNQNFENIEIVLYQSTTETLERFAQISSMYCDRFHSIVLANAYNIESDKSSYDSKATNYLETPQTDKISNAKLFHVYRGSSNE